MARKEDLIVGLDIGTTKICAVVAEETENGVDIVGIGTHPSRGLRKGVVVDIDATVDSIKHAVEEAELMADRIGVINKGAIILVEEKAELIRKLGRKQLTLHLQAPLAAIPESLEKYGLEPAGDGSVLHYTYDTQGERTGITALLADLGDADIRFRDLETKESSLEDIFVDLVRNG